MEKASLMFMKRAVVFSPYVPTTFGGGEKYLFDFAQALSNSHKVDVAISDKYRDISLDEVKLRYEKFLGRDLSHLHFVYTPIFWKARLSEKIWWTKKYDVLFYVTDGSFFPSLARKNILHIQVPLMRESVSALEKIKLLNWTAVSNSYFTKEVVERVWQVKVPVVLQPAINLTREFNPDCKRKVILNVGRFFPQLHSKRQDILIESFIKIRAKYPQEARGWRLVLIGSAEDKSFAQKVKKMAEGLPIDILHQVSRPELEDWFQVATFYWHAAGYGVDQKFHPELVEHFGISTVEAMSKGCVPLVVGKGGQIEVLGEGLEDLLWSSTSELATKTAELIKHPDKLSRLAIESVEQSNQFNQTLFNDKVERLIK